MEALVLRRTILKGFAGFVIGLPFIAACESGGGKSSGSGMVSEAARKDVLAVLPKNYGFERLNTLVKSAGMLDELMGPGHFTLFAPTDSAFGALGENELVRLSRPANRDELVRLLRNHLLNQVVLRKDLKRGQSLRTLAKASLTVDAHGQQIDVNTANLLATDLPPRQY
jgi:uncharacterized surface protein with fasciclin (FAS1) repeats